ncbi:MAG TPA: ABC transporter ATP-binding protein [Stellaceae bacterium]|nr:ABC transporter ATP-binding protein [Stellaceae bacterium]
MTVDMVRLDRCTKNYGSVTALAEIDLTIARGEFVTLLGPSGSGKTTLLNLIAGMIVPSAGRIFIDGKDATALPPSKRGLGMVFQNYALMPHMTVFDNIAFPLRVRRLPAAEIRRKVTDVLKMVQLPDVAGRKPRALSGGQQQRISLARCIVYNPAIILMDEPLGALDKKLREDMQLEIKRLHQELGITMLYVTHDQEEALVMSDRIVLLTGGRVAQMGTPDELYHRPLSTFVANFLGHSNMIVGSIEDQGPPVRVRTRDGLGFLSQPLPSELAPVARKGETVSLMVRPENVTIAGAADASRKLENTVEGTVNDSVNLGGVIRHYVACPGGRVFISVEFNRPGLRILEKGTRVQLAWRALDMRLLPSGDGGTTATA